VTDDSVSRRLAEVAPVAPDLLEAFGRFEHLAYADLVDEFARHTERFKAWVEDPANLDRPISEWPGYLDRIALDALIERRTWME
jgi:hypothetical protein